MNPEMQKDLVKIRFRDQQTDNTETLWATPVGGDRYRLENSPFFAYGVSWQDVVEARAGEDGVLDYVRRIEKSGNRTIRVIFPDYKINDHQGAGVLAALRDLGCTYEGMQPRLVSINIPPKVNLKSVTDFLNGRSGLQWEYGDPTYAEVTERIN
jgi:Domain of unknown function (DUF4265)